MNIKENDLNKALQGVIQLIETSGAFDKKYYSTQLKKIGKTHKNPIEHYLLEGWRIGLEPHPCFVTEFYLNHNNDVKETKSHPFLHFVMHGHLEDRFTRDGFSLTYYRKQHPEITASGINPFKHFTKKYGQTEPKLSTPTIIPQSPVISAPATFDLQKLTDEAVARGLFDLDWYSETYGKSFKNAYEGFADYLEKSRFSPVNPSNMFDSESYHRMHNDVYHAQISPLFHYLISGNQEGRPYNAQVPKWQPQTIIETQPRLLPKAKSLKIAICLHIFYEDYIEKFAAALKNFPIKVDLFITLGDAKHESKALETFRKLRTVGKVQIRCVPNRGRNFGPLLVEYAEELNSYDLFCHLHSKKSLYSGREQTQWSDYLTEYLLRDPHVVSRLLNAFVEDEELGLYYPTTFWMMPSWVNHVTMNKSFMKPWQQKLDMDVCDGFLSYPAGGMFWARPEALKGILDNKYSYEDFPLEPLPNDGSMLHALERIIGSLVEHNKYKQFFYSPSVNKFTTDSSYITYNYHNNIENIQAHLRNFSTVSFDVFDTLVRRKYTVADYAKLLLGKELVSTNLVASAQNFVDLRNNSEFELRKRSSFRGDVRLTEIYSEIAVHLKLSEEEAQRLMRREFELDLDMISAKDEMVDLFNSLGSHGHVLWVISDTYYSREQVGLMLRKAGVTGAYRLLVSSEEQKRKDNGTMWQMVKTDLEGHGVRSYVHVGDNVVADCQVPGDLGLATVHILHPMDKWLALGFPKIGDNPASMDEMQIKKWGKLVSCVGRIPFI